MAVLAIAWLTLRLYGQYGSNPYQPGAVRYGEVTDTRVTGWFDVQKPAGRTGVCRLRALGSSGAEVGYAEVNVGTSAQATTAYAITTASRAAVVEILGCADAPQ